LARTGSSKEGSLAERTNHSPSKNGETKNGEKPERQAQSSTRLNGDTAMPRKKNGPILNDSINMPVPRKLKKEIVEFAENKGVSHTALARGYVEEGFEKDRRRELQTSK
jgi:hypothetical protein